MSTDPPTHYQLTTAIVRITRFSKINDAHFPAFQIPLAEGSESALRGTPPVKLRTRRFGANSTTCLSISRTGLGGQGLLGHELCRGSLTRQLALRLIGRELGRRGFHLSKADAWLQIEGPSLASARVECTLLSIPTMLRVFLSKSATCSLIFYGRIRTFQVV